MFLLATLYLVLFIAATLAFIGTLCLYQKKCIEVEKETEEKQKYQNLYLNLHKQFYEIDWQCNNGYYEAEYKLREKPLDIRC